MVSQRLDATLAIAVIPAIKRGSRDAEFVQRALGRQVDCSTSRMISAFSDAGYLMPRPPHLLPDSECKGIPRKGPFMFYGMARPSHRRRRVADGTEGGTEMDIAVLGVDLGENVCSIVGLDASGAVVMRRKVRRETLIALVGKLPPCVVGMEACCGAHHLGRLFAAHDHEVRLMSPEYVRPYVKAQKNDDRDAEGIAEAATRPTMRFVGLKSQDQLDMQTLHRSRDRLVGERTALINQLRAILLERGLVAPQGKRKLEHSWAC